MPKLNGEVMRIKFICFLIPIIFIGCATDEPQIERKQIKSDKKSETLISENTVISQSEIDVVSINISTSICGSCENNIKEAVIAMNGVIQAEIDADKKIAKIKYDKRLTDPSKIRKVISKAGYDADDTLRDEEAYDKLDECCKVETHT